MDAPTLQVDLPEAHVMGIVFAHGGHVYTPTRHEVLDDGPFMQAVKRWAREANSRVAEDLFLCYHRINKTFLLAYWITGIDPVKAMVGIDLYGEHPDHTEDPPTQERVMHCLMPREKQMRLITRQVKDERMKFIVERQRQGQLTKEHAAKALSRGHESEAAIASIGATPYHFPDDKGELERVEAQLRKAKE